jgi:integrase
VDTLADASSEPGLIRFAALTGLRQHELFNLTDVDVESKEQAVHVRKSKTKAGVRRVPLVAEARQIVRQQKLSRPHGSTLIFPAPEGGRWNPNNFGHRVFRPARNAVGMNDVQFHDLRRTFASWMAEARTYPKTLQKIMGHESFAVTMDVYAQLPDEAVDEAIADFDAHLSPGAAPSLPHAAHETSANDVYTPHG